MAPEKRTKIPPMRNIRFRERAWIRRLRRKSRTKNAQGLKLSSPPRTMVNRGSDISSGSTSPRKGTVMLFSSSRAFTSDSPAMTASVSGHPCLMQAATASSMARAFLPENPKYSRSPTTVAGTPTDFAPAAFMTRWKKAEFSLFFQTSNSRTSSPGYFRLSVIMNSFSFSQCGHPSPQKTKTESRSAIMVLVDSRLYLIASLHLQGKPLHQGKPRIQRLDHAPALRPLSHELPLERVGEIEHQDVSLGHAVPAHDGFEPAEVPSFRVVFVQVVRDLSVVRPRMALADPLLHEPRQAGEHVHGRKDPFLVQVPRKHDLAFGDIPREVGNGMGDVVLGHGDHGQERDRALKIVNAPRALIERREVGIHIARIAAPARPLLPGRGYFAQGVAVVRHVRDDHQDVHALFEGQVLGHGQGKARGQDALHHRLVGHVHEGHEARFHIFERPQVEGVLVER